MAEQYEINPEKDYGMDESPMILGFAGKQRVLLRPCADGTVLQPTIIFKAKHSKSRGVGTRQIRLEHRYAALRKAIWTKKANSRYCCLFVDNHASHCTIKFLCYACNHKIIIVGYPPHCTHWLQGLDVVYFACVKSVWGTECHRIEQDEEGKVLKGEFIRVYARVPEQAFMEELIKMAFAKTGIQLFDPSVITAEMTAPCHDSWT
ncbi:hypothetical protein M407DRAFT_33305 [Tulasnella calospora MUT 4182]|uniref:DDE-1 domain-containing protein n=1 Tax=Tulasnella calospora MUT 4182 TaxID=1051891 RepID=A0A0C3K6P4_9AGAM|nr:hypothetical protein M407DRAFT_33305 [Tulasnella calospora MUT 4182]